MNYSPVSKFINTDNYDYLVSIGNKCPTAMILNELNVYGESFPFDYIPTTPALVLKYLKNQDDYYPEKNIVRTKDDVWFGHFDISDNYVQTIETFQRRFARLFDVLQKQSRILFVYTSEADVYNEMNNRYNDNYNDITKLVEYICETYKYNDFRVLCIHTNKTFEDTNKIINYTLNVADKYLSDDMSTHVHETCAPYRYVLKTLMGEIFQK